ncbi:MAG TPA: YibE/F family protein [Acidimicrobiales bacterium]
MLTVAVVIVGALAVLGAVALWPRGDAPDAGPSAPGYVDATVTAVDGGSFTAELTSGPDRGDTVEVALPTDEPGEAAAVGRVEAMPDLEVGDEVVLLDVASSPQRYRYSFADIQRGSSLLWLAAVFVLVVVAFGRWRGVRSLVGLAAGGAILLAFLVPALLRDKPAVPVVLAATAIMAFVALYLAHGVNLGTTVALAGTLASLALTCGLALLAVEVTELTALADGRARTLPLGEALDLRGLLVAGIVVGALGVLDDVTVSQVSIVAALRRANPGLPRRVLYLEATRVGRDHMASTVNTLVLAYAGAALPLLLLFAQGDQPAGRLVTGELISVEIVRMLVGAIGLVASVPVTTALAALVLGPGDRDARGNGDRDDPVDRAPAHLAGLTQGE